MSTQKGVTLTSLTIYVIVVGIVLGILLTITTNFQIGIGDMNEEGTKNVEIDNFNMYFLREVKKNGNKILEMSPSKIKFSTNNEYKFENSNIYLNGNIKIASDINKCEFSQELIEGKIIIKVVIKAKNTTERTIEYVLNDSEFISGYEDEESYIYTEPM
jgi:hypothetical protein